MMLKTYVVIISEVNGTEWKVILVNSSFRTNWQAELWVNGYKAAKPDCTISIHELKVSE
jgi:hypothetical protein